MTGVFLCLIATNVLTLTSVAFNGALSGLMSTAFGIQTVADVMSQRLTGKDKVIKQQKATAIKHKAAVKKFGTRLSVRTRRVATRSIAAIPAEVIPYLGIAVLIGGTAYELSEACQSVRDLEAREMGVGAFMCDTIFDTQGTLEAPKDYFQRVYQKVRAAGGLCIADEVQAGLCRTGRWWGFEHYDVIPDIVTLGKPMGDGHPLAMVITTEAIASAFAERAFYFNTFGGNPVSAAVGTAVLEVCEQEGLSANCAEVGDYLRQRLEQLAARQPLIGDVRGHGLFLGVELVEDRQSRHPATGIARQVPDAMKAQGVLMGISGRHGNVLKIRPPLTFNEDNADQLVDTMQRVLDASRCEGG